MEMMITLHVYVYIFLMICAVIIGMSIGITITIINIIKGNWIILTEKELDNETDQR